MVATPNINGMPVIPGALNALGLTAAAPTQNPYSNQILQAAGQAAPQLNQGPANQLGQMQLQQINQLQGIASGQQQGAGELAVQRQVANAQAANQAAARMARGGTNSALAYRQAANNTAATGMSGAGQAQQAALTDQMNAQNMLGQQLNQARGQDIGIAGQNAQLQAGQNQLGMNGYLGLGGQNLQAQQQAAQMQNAQTSGLLGGLGSLLGLGGGPSQGSANNSTGGGPVGGALGIASLFSDEDAKTDIQDGRDAIDKMLDGIKAKSYRYKDEKMGKGKRVGVMAQDMSKSAMGAATVKPVDGFQALDVNKALSAALAASGRLHERVKALEAVK
jgi:hypothetical protein